MAILREDLFVAFFSAARSPNLACLSGVCQVALSLYAHLGSHLLLQVSTHLVPVLDSYSSCGKADFYELKNMFVEHAMVEILKGYVHG